MQHRMLGAVAVLFSAAIALIGVAALAGDTVVNHDERMLMLDANYHDLPNELVTQLRAKVPPRPYGLDINRACYVFDRKWPRANVRYCICWDDEGCRDLKLNECGAKLGALSWSVGVCRAREERVIVVG